MNTNIKYFLIAAACLCMPALAQNDATYEDQNAPVVKVKKPAKPQPTYTMQEVKGVVVDAATKQPISGVQVQALENMLYSAMTNAKGEFTIKVPEFETTLIAFTPQYQQQKVAIAKGETLHISMISDKFRPMYTNSTNILAAPATSVRNTTETTAETQIGNLMGGDVRVITRSGGPGYGAALFVRGLNSLNADAQPLVVLDGVIQDMQQTREALHDGDYTNLFLHINPEDIDNIQVLKNGTAIFGAKGGNGVILINTKRGHSLATRIDANIGVGVTLMPKLPDMMDENQFRAYAGEVLGTYPDINKMNNGEQFWFLNNDPARFYYKWYNGNNTDWTKEVYHEALTQNYNINVQGGDNVGMYNLSLGYTNAQSTAKENGFDRLNVRFNNNLTILKKLTTRFDMSFSKINRNVFNNGAPEDFSAAPVSSPTFLALIKAPFLNPYTFNTVTGQISSTLYGADDFLTGTENHRTGLPSSLSLGNPTSLLEHGEGNNKNRSEQTHFNATIAPTYEFNPTLKLTETFSYTYDYNSQRYYRPKEGMPRFQIPDVGTVENMTRAFSGKETSVASDTRLEWNKIFGAHKLNVYGGIRFTTFSYEENIPEGQYASGGNDKNPNISTNMTYQEATGANDNWTDFTWYANVDYNWRNLYFLQASLALEANSRFGSNADGLNMAGVPWGVFPSIQAGWALSSESWFPKNKTLNYFLLRAGYDISGNDGISNYAARTSFNYVKYLYLSNGMQLNNMGNDKIQWEQTGKFNVGFNSAWFDNRVTFDFDFYMNHTSNLLTLKNIDNPVIGVAQYWSNGGSLDNTGIEATITGKPLISNTFNIELGVSVGHYKNEVKSLPSGDYTSSIYGQDNILTAVGHPVGVFYGYQTDGVISSDDKAKGLGRVDGANPEGYLYMEDAAGQRQYFKAGDMHFLDLNGDGKINEQDRTIIGDPNPDIYGNIFATINWKRLTLSAVFNYSVGNDIYNYSRSVLEAGSNFYNQTVAMTNRWHADGQVTDIPRAYYGDPKGNSRFSDRWIEDGSYLRLKTLNLTYRIPANLEWLQGLTIWAEANNLFTLTKYLGSDPESSVSNAVLRQGIDVGNVPQSRSFTMGLRINL